MRYLPVSLDLRGRRVLIVGGGTVALQKLNVLFGLGAEIEVIAPAILNRLEQIKEIRVRRAEFQDADLDGIFMVIAATDDPELNHHIQHEAEKRDILVNVVDDPAYCDFIFPSILRRGELAVSVSTAGASPSLARQLRQELEEEFHSEYGEVLALTRHFRLEARRRIRCPGARRAAVECISRLALAYRQFGPTGLGERMEEIIEEIAASEGQRTKDKGQRTNYELQITNGKLNDYSSFYQPDCVLGSLTLVGAGPGDPDLLTLGAVKALRQADIVIYDRLVNPLLLQYAPRAEHVYMGKEVGEPHSSAQRNINDFIIEQALRGRRVVRLKGGDPYIFGRGGEEAMAARARGIAVKVIPGVTAAIGAGASAGIPLTHREIASSVAFITGCAAGGHQQNGPDWQALASAVDTIVIYMGTRQMPQIARELMTGGRPEDEPVAVVHNATLPEEEIVVRALGDFIANPEPPVPAPTIMIIGEVVRLREEIRELLQEAAAGMARIQ